MSNDQKTKEITEIRQLADQLKDKKRLGKENAEKIENKSNIFNNMRILGEDTRITKVENIRWDYEKGKFVERDQNA